MYWLKTAERKAGRPLFKHIRFLCDLMAITFKSTLGCASRHRLGIDDKTVSGWTIICTNESQPVRQLPIPAVINYETFRMLQARAELGHNWLAARTARHRTLKFCAISNIIVLKLYAWLLQRTIASYSMKADKSHFYLRSHYDHWNNNEQTLLLFGVVEMPPSEKAGGQSDKITSPSQGEEEKAYFTKQARSSAISAEQITLNQCQFSAVLIFFSQITNDNANVFWGYSALLRKILR